MTPVTKDIFKAIHEGKWLSIEYRNKDEQTTKYWIGIKDINLKYRMLTVDGLHLVNGSLRELKIYIDSIIFSAVIDGSYCEINHGLVEDIKLNPNKYQELFGHAPNLKILNYLADCNKLDTTPYKSEYSLIKHFDGECLTEEVYRLSNSQFDDIVRNFQYKASEKLSGKKSDGANTMNNIRQLCLNILSVNTKKGLYVLAYRKLNFDVKERVLRPAKEITVCKEFTINGTKESIRKFLDADDFSLLEDFERNQEEIKDKITEYNKQIEGVDDMPYIIAIGMDVMLDLSYEYSAIIDMYNKNSVTVPIKAFFGDLIKRPERRKEYPVALLNKKVNLDQLLAINNAVKYPVAYIQGPPGTGKTNTIINTITTAFFNGKTVLFTSYNNHPIDSVFEILRSIQYKNSCVPFPAIRLGNNSKVKEAIIYIKNMYEKTQNIKIYESTLERNKDDKIERTKKLTELLKKHEELLDLLERKETIEKLMQSNRNLTFQFDLQGKQLNEVNERLKNIGKVTDEEALSLLTDSEEDFIKYLYYVSAKYIKRLDEPKNKDLLDIIYMQEEDGEQVKCFNKYLSDEKNIKKFLNIFPVVLTTCISAHKLGEPKQYFDMVIIDEASQCNTAVSLVPIIRGESLMLVGDPQQLNPVILLDRKDNSILKHSYSVPGEYDYIENSIYKTFLACDSVSDEILLSSHYRCDEKIIDFSNKKYYNSKLNIKSNLQSDQALVYIDVKNNKTTLKNTSPEEAEKIIEYIKDNKDKKIGVITPFANQKDYINTLLGQNGLKDVTCGTVHAFQGDEKDIILFSLAITDQTRTKTYDWLKNNKELINVATSRAREKLILLTSDSDLERLHRGVSDDIYELAEYVKTNGSSEVTKKTAVSRALGIKPYSTETEEAFLVNLNHAIDNILFNNRRCVIHKEVAISHVFKDNIPYNDLFYSGRFDFVVYEKIVNKQEIPIFAIELDGKEHLEDETVKERDRKKNEICRRHGFELIRIENSYARRYNYVKDILINYFTN